MLVVKLEQFYDANCDWRRRLSCRLLLTRAWMYMCGKKKSFDKNTCKSLKFLHHCSSEKNTKPFNFQATQSRGNMRSRYVSFDKCCIKETKTWFWTEGSVFLMITSCLSERCRRHLRVDAAPPRVPGTTRRERAPRDVCSAAARSGSDGGSLLARKDRNKPKESTNGRPRISLGRWILTDFMRGLETHRWAQRHTFG